MEEAAEFSNLLIKRVKKEKCQEQIANRHRLSLILLLHLSLRSAKKVFKKDNK